MIAAEVYLWGTRIGVVLQERMDAIPRFNYDRNFIRSGIQVSPLVMPLSDRVYSFPALNIETFHGLPGLLADSLPDKFGTKLIERYLMDQGRKISDFSSVERLCYVGNRGMGALEYVPDRNYVDAADRSVDINALVQLASDILAERKSVHVDGSGQVMEQIIKIGTSAGGAQAKAIVAWNETTNDIRSGQIEAGNGYHYWLIKFDGVENNKDKGDKADGPAYTRIEYAYYLMAKAAGIAMNDCRLYRENGNYHFMTKRFDRESDLGRKIHMQSLGAIAHYDFNMPGTHSYEQAADVIYRLEMGQKDIEQLFRRMVFNIAARNQDDHVKNISFLMDRNGIWSLAPAYDVTYAYDRTNHWLSKHQMSVNGKLENITMDDVLSCGKRMNISKNKIRKITEEVNAAVGRWQIFAENAFLNEQTYLEVSQNHVLL